MRAATPPRPRGEKGELNRHELLPALLGACGEHAVSGEAPHMITLAKPSIALSRPKPTRAIDDASTPEAIATAPSTVIHARLTQDSARARWASFRYRSRASR